MLTDFRYGKRRAFLRTVFAALACFAALVPLIYGLERLSLSMSQNGFTTHEGPPEPFLQVEGPGLTRPPTSGIEASGMRDDDEVIGVEVGGRARAYRLGALRGRMRHIVNDMLGGVPVSVAYCDINECSRAYINPGGTDPIDLSVGGLYTSEVTQMVVKLDGVYYLHKSGEPVKSGSGSPRIPYQTIEPTRTTWKEWVKLHPRTDVFTGDRDKDLK